MMKALLFSIFFMTILSLSCTFAQTVPSSYENIDHLMTFSKGADPKWGDDDHVQIYFFSIPKTNSDNAYIRVFDPNCGGELDQNNGSFDSRTSFTIYGGKEAYSNPNARHQDPIKGYDSGTLLESKTFGDDDTYEMAWYTFGPFNPKEGEYDEETDAYIFKVIIKGEEGNDGNGYRLALSSSKDENHSIDQGKAFAYEVAFRLKVDKNEIAHFYPFMDQDVVKVKQNNFDFDRDGMIRITSVAKNQQPMAGSSDGNWGESIHDITAAEKGSCLDIHILKSSDAVNDMVIFMENQYGETLPFLSSPIGDYKYKYKVKVKIN